MKRVLTTTLLFLALAIPAFAVDYPDQEGNVYDGAGMLPEQTEIALEQKLLDFESATTIGIGVATVPSLQGMSGERLPTPLFQPVATAGSLKTLDWRDVQRLGYRHVLMNTYHLVVRPGNGTARPLGQQTAPQRIEPQARRVTWY